MAVITISRQYGSGGSDVARRVADALSWGLVDQQFVALVAERVGLPPEEVASREERVEGLLERLARTLTVSAPEVFIAAGQPADVTSPEDEIHRVTETVIAEATQHGDVVLVGRGAQACLGERADAIHVFVIAPRHVRVERVAARLAVSPKEAERRLTAIDDGRRHYVETHYDRVWDDPARYHLVVNTGFVSHDEAAAIVTGAARRRWPTTGASG